MADLLTDALPPVSLADMITEVEREIRMRRAVYPHQVARGNTRQSTADERIRRMEAVLATLRALEEQS